MDYVQIGFLGKVHGLKGELKLTVEEQFADDFNMVDVVFLKVKGHFMPFFIDSIRGENTPIIKFEETNNKEAAAAIQHQPLFMKASDLTIIEVDETEMELQYQQYKAFMIVDETLGKLGEIESIEEFPQQEMAVITYQGNEILIPLNESMIVKIDEVNKVIQVDLPEGLLEI
jgi:16S rRNA processing protein RimM